MQKWGRPRCGARTVKGTPCQAQALKNGRCFRHGGLSTGPRTPEGKAKRAAIAREQMKALQAKWAIENGGKPPLSEAGRQRNREAQKRRWEIYRMPPWQRLLENVPLDAPSYKVGAGRRTTRWRRPKPPTT